MAMRKASVAILAGVLLFTLTIVGVLVLRSRTVRDDRAEVSPTKADYRIKEVHLQEHGSDNLVWKLDADQAEVFEQHGRTIIRGVSITIEEPGRTWRVTGGEGDFVHATKGVTVRGNVVVVSSDGIRLETDLLRWQARERRVWTDAPVTFSRAGIVVKGQGLDTLLAEERASVNGPVRATIVRAAAPRAAAPLGDRGQAR